jgi:hypothetical protein
VAAAREIQGRLIAPATTSHFLKESAMRIAVPLALTAFFLAASMASPARAAEGQEGIKMMLDTITAGCQGMNTQFRQTPGLGSALSARPESALCDCVEKRLNAMPLIEELRKFDDAKLETLIEGETFKDYLVAKLSATMFTCVTDELDAGADAIKPKM